MPSTTSYDFGDIVLVHFPFTDLSSTKKRPAVIVSSAAFQREQINLIVMAVTSVMTPSLRTGEARLEDWKGAGLLKPSMVKPMLVTLARRLARKKLGKLSKRDEAKDRKALDAILG